MRLHLFEFEDQVWFPKILRDYQTGYIGFLASRANLYEAVPEMLEKMSAAHIVDLASGAGTPAIAATEAIRQRGGSLVLTDKFPNTEAMASVGVYNHVVYRKEPLDVLKDPFPSGDTYTVFNAFHHFTDDEQLAILHKAKATGGSILVLEPLQRNLFTFLKVLLSTTLGPILLSPFIRPFTWSRMLFTYLIPIGIVVTLWDGIVSVMRSFSNRDCQKLKLQAKLSDLNLKVGKLPSRFGDIIYLQSS